MVVLPQPLGPTIATNSDCAISRVISPHASTTPFLVLYVLATPCRRMCGSVIGAHKYAGLPLPSFRNARQRVSGIHNHSPGGCVPVGVPLHVSRLWIPGSRAFARAPE